MKHIHLVGYCDEPTGELGLLIKGTALSDNVLADRNGGLIAHDLLEHQNGLGRIGRLDDELEALGAIWQLRGRHGDFVDGDRRFYSYRPPEERVATDVVSVFEDLGCYDDWFPQIGQYNTRPHDEDDSFRAILAHARPQLYLGLEEPDTVPAFLDNALHLMRTGYRKAERRFGSGYQGLTMYAAVKRAVAEAIPSLEYEGQLFRLSYGAGEARITEIHQ